jgi:hypothetical protein
MAAVHRKDHPNPTPTPPVLEVRTDEFIFLADDLPCMDMVELSPGIWGPRPCEFHPS